MKKVSMLTSILLFLGVLLSPYSTLAAPLDEVKEIISENYAGDIPQNLNHYTSIQEIMNQLDQYSTYFSKEEYEKYNSSINNETTGIGIVIGEIQNGIEILDVFEETPAYRAGIEPGDIILSIDGVSTKGMSIQQASSYITGKEGTTVVLQVQKQGNIQTYIITRTNFSVPVVTKRLLLGNVGYITLSSFSDDGARMVNIAKESLKKEGATSFIVDLRNNGGGYVDTAEKLIGLFPSSPYAYKMKMRNGETIVPSVRQTSLFPANTRVLINGSSASASEMTAAALKDQKSAILYGQTTFGKGSMQSFYPISDGSYLKLTIANFTGPKGTVINHKGVIPHVKTDVGKELEQAHFDSLIESKKGYKKIKALTNVLPSKEFTITFSGSVHLNKKEKVELIQLGEARNLPIEIEKISSTQLLVKPVNVLKNGAAYVLFIHPTTSKAGKVIEAGAYVKVTVRP